MCAGKDGKARVSSFSSLLPSSFPPSPSSKSPFESSTANGNDEKRLGRNQVCQVKSLLIQVHLRSGVPLLVCLCGFAFTSVSDLFAHLHVYRSKRFQGGFVINFGKKKITSRESEMYSKTHRLPVPRAFYRLRVLILISLLLVTAGFVESTISVG